MTTSTSPPPGRFSPVHVQNLGVGLATGKGFAHPVDVATDGAATVYVLNRSNAWKDRNPRITVTTWDETNFSEIGHWGPGPSGLTTPSGLAVDNDGNLLVTDEDTHTVTTFAPDGTPLRRWGTRGNGPGELDRPAGIACDRGGRIWVTDHGNHRIQCYDPTGRHLGTIGTTGNGPEQLRLPWGLTVDDDGCVWVADWGNNRIQVYAPDGSVVRQLGAGLLRRPAAVQTSPDGQIHVSDWGNDCVRVFDSSGAPLATLAGQGALSRWAQEYLQVYPLVAESYHAALEAGTLTAVHRFHRPSGMALHPDGLLLIADTGRHRVQTYQVAPR
ncbi:MAG: NHL repeat-containing protein [Pseudonocardiales bacterium]